MTTSGNRISSSLAIAGRLTSSIRPMPVAIALGGESVMPYAATAPLPPGISELLLAGYLNKAGIPLVRARTVPLWVPANAEIIIEGFVSHEAGPIGFDPRGVADSTPVYCGQDSKL